MLFLQDNQDLFYIFFFFNLMSMTVVVFVVVIDVVFFVVLVTLVAIVFFFFLVLVLVFFLSFCFSFQFSLSFIWFFVCLFLFLFLFWLWSRFSYKLTIWLTCFFAQTRRHIAFKLAQRRRLQCLEIDLNLIRIRVAQRWLTVLYNVYHTSQFVAQRRRCRDKFQYKFYITYILIY